MGKEIYRCVSHRHECDNICDELCSIELYLPQVGYDMELLNEHVRHLMESLQARGETTYDLMSFLFKA
jgi:hypothetical protein